MLPSVAPCAFAQRQSIKTRIRAMRPAYDLTLTITQRRPMLPATNNLTNRLLSSSQRKRRPVSSRKPRLMANPLKRSPPKPSRHQRAR